MTATLEGDIVELFKLIQNTEGSSAQDVLMGFDIVGLRKREGRLLALHVIRNSSLVHTRVVVFMLYCVA